MKLRVPKTLFEPKCTDTRVIPHTHAVFQQQGVKDRGTTVRLLRTPESIQILELIQLSREPRAALVYIWNATW